MYCKKYCVIFVISFVYLDFIIVFLFFFVGIRIIEILSVKKYVEDINIIW